MADPRSAHHGTSAGMWNRIEGGEGSAGTCGANGTCTLRRVLIFVVDRYLDIQYDRSRINDTISQVTLYLHDHWTMVGCAVNLVSDLALPHISEAISTMMVCLPF